MDLAEILTPPEHDALHETLPQDPIRVPLPNGGTLLLYATFHAHATTDANEVHAHLGLLLEKVTILSPDETVLVENLPLHPTEE